MRLNRPESGWSRSSQASATRRSSTHRSRSIVSGIAQTLQNDTETTQSARQDDFVARRGAFYSISGKHSGPKFLNNDPGLAAARTESDNAFPQWTHSSARLERLPHMQEVPGSSPGASTIVYSRRRR